MADFDLSYILDKLKYFDRKFEEMGLVTEAPVHSLSAIGCRVIRTTVQNIPNTTTTPLSFSDEINDVGNCWSIANPTRLYARRAGYYCAGGGWAMDSSVNTAASLMICSVLKSGVNFGGGMIHTIAGKLAICSISTGMFYLAKDEYVEIHAYHDQGGNRNAKAATTTDQAYFCGWLSRLS